MAVPMIVHYSLRCFKKDTPAFGQIIIMTPTTRTAKEQRTALATVDLFVAFAVPAPSKAVALTVAQRLMEFEVEGVCCAAHGECGASGRIGAITPAAAAGRRGRERYLCAFPS